ncbi:MAG: MaoC/PaaZ C-terminal domain-containing protein [Acetobacteraceae bacterium]|nr:MaoC/PaaZ C-terminal domain-containing protein [Acetobacteraceae bacterium]
MRPSAAALVLEDLSIGQSAAFDAVITGNDIDAFAALSGDTSPLHVDATFARDRGFGDRVAHGAHLVALASRLAGMYLPGRNALLLAVNASFAAPVLPGTRVTVSGVVEQVSDSVRSVVLKLRVVDTDSRATLARGRLTIGFTDGGPARSTAHG